MNLPLIHRRGRDLRQVYCIQLCRGFWPLDWGTVCSFLSVLMKRVILQKALLYRTVTLFQHIWDTMLCEMRCAERSENTKRGDNWHRHMLWRAAVKWRLLGCHFGVNSVISKSSAALRRDSDRGAELVVAVRAARESLPRIAEFISHRRLSRRPRIRPRR